MLLHESQDNNVMSIFSGFIQALDEAKPKIIKSVTLSSLTETCAVGAAALGAKNTSHPLTIDYDKMVDKFFTYQC